MFFKALLEDFVNPAERLYWPVLVSSIFFAWIFLYFGGERKNAFPNIVKNLLSKDIWLHPSSITDFKWFFINNSIRFVFLNFFVGFFLSAYSLSIMLLEFLREYCGEVDPIMSDRNLIRLVYTIGTFVILDFFRFLQHFLMHKVPCLWKFHKLHHSAEVLTPMTLNRVHPVELFIGMGRTALATALSSALYVYLFQVPLHGFDILGVNIVGFLFNVLGANLRHSQIWISFGPMEYIFMGPAQHQIHHSSALGHRNKNFGICLSVWDILFKTFFKTKGKIQLQFGLSSTNLSRPS